MTIVSIPDRKYGPYYITRINLINDDGKLIARRGILCNILHVTAFTNLFYFSKEDFLNNFLKIYIFPS